MGPIYSESLEDLDSLFAFGQSEFKYCWDKEALSDYFSDTSSIYTILVHELEVIGYCLCNYNKFSKEVHLYQICISKSHRLKGYGLEIFKRTLKQACNFESVFLEVEVDNIPALSFYEKNGFKKLNQIKAFYSDGADAFAMHCIDSKLAKLLNT